MNTTSRTCTVHPMERASAEAPEVSDALIPGSKSHTIRALLLAALSSGVTRIVNPLYSHDTESCIRVVENWGATITRRADFLEVDNAAFDAAAPLRPLQPVVDAGNSGTTLYFATALAALSEHPLTFDGDASLRTRTAAPLLAALVELGARIDDANNGCVPYTVRGPIRAGSIGINCPTSQYASALLFALSCVSGKSEIRPVLAGEHPYVDMTIEWLRRSGAEIRNENYERIVIEKGLGLPARSASPMRIGGDFSSASFFFAVPAVCGQSVRVRGLNPEDTQADKRVLDVLAAMGVPHAWEADGQGGFAVTLRRESDALRGGEFDLSAIPDALPILSVCAAYANAPLRLYNVAHARAKETDRIAVMARELARLGARVTEHPDGLTVHGGAGLSGGETDSHHDHRIAMAFAVGALGAQGPVSVRNAEAAAVTFPNFYELLAGLGARLEMKG